VTDRGLTTPRSHASGDTLARGQTRSVGSQGQGLPGWSGPSSSSCLGLFALCPSPLSPVPASCPLGLFAPGAPSPLVAPVPASCPLGLFAPVPLHPLSPSSCKLPLLASLPLCPFHPLSPVPASCPLGLFAPVPLHPLSPVPASCPLGLFAPVPLHPLSPSSCKLPPWPLCPCAPSPLVPQAPPFPGEAAPAPEPVLVRLCDRSRFCRTAVAHRRTSSAAIAQGVTAIAADGTPLVYQKNTCFTPQVCPAERVRESSSLRPCASAQVRKESAAPGFSARGAACCAEEGTRAASSCSSWPWGRMLARNFVERAERGS